MNIRMYTRLLLTVSLVSGVVLMGMSRAQAQQRVEMSDIAISDKVEDELLHDSAVVSTRIDISTADRIVTLSGEVSNLLAKERAARIAETVRGVRSVVNRIQVEPSVTRTDAQIRRDIEAALLADPATESYDIGVAVQDGAVKLTGGVDSYQERELAKKVAKGVRGVRAIDDQIEIQYKSDRPDVEIENEIKRTLRWNTHVDHNLIEVGVNDGKVALTGTVGSAAEKRLAESDAWVAGVESVNSSKLSVAGWARDPRLRGDKYVVKSERKLEQAVEDALLFDPRVKSFEIGVTAAGGAVTLRGEVDNLKAKRAAGQDASNTVGVAYVRNRLKVRPDTTRSDEEIAESIRGALLRDPYVERFEINVTVLNGTAHLYGTVDSFYEKNRADDVASRVAGVLDVDNHLDINDETAYIYDPYVDDTHIEEGDLARYQRRRPLETDYEIKDEIESELFWSPFVDSDRITVTVDDGIANLTGTVETWNESMAATENAYEGGATLVDNDLTVSYNYD